MRFRSVYTNRTTTAHTCRKRQYNEYGIPVDDLHSKGIKLLGFTFRPPDGETTQLPSIIDNHVSNVTAILGGLAVLKCTVLNLGTKTVIWRKANKKDPLTIGLLTFSPDKRFQVTNIPRLDEWNLIIKDVIQKDAGVYECQISSTDRSIRQQVYLTVQGIKISDTTYVEKGDRIVLMCNATSDDVDWFKQGQKVVTDPEKGIRISKNEYMMKQMITSVLEIEKATMQDDSDYVCRSTDLQTDNVKVHVLNAGTFKIKRRNFGETKYKNDSHVANRSSNVTAETTLFHLCIILGPFLIKLFLLER